MVKFALYNTEGNIQAQGAEGAPQNCGDIVASISAYITPLYFSSRQGKRLLGAAFRVAPVNTSGDLSGERRRSLVYMEESDWIMNRQSSIHRNEIAAFFHRAVDTVEREGFTIDVGNKNVFINDADKIFTLYLQNIRKQTGGGRGTAVSQRGRLNAASKFPAPLISQTFSRIIYGESARAATEHMETAISFICDVTSSYLNLMAARPQCLNDGFAFSIASGIASGVDLNVFLSLCPDDVDGINLDTLELTKDGDNSSYYENALKLVTGKNTSETLPRDINKDSIPTWIIQQTLSPNGSIMKKPEREKYRAFLNSALIQYDRQLFDAIDRKEEKDKRDADIALKQAKAAARRAAVKKFIKGLGTLLKKFFGVIFGIFGIILGAIFRPFRAIFRGVFGKRRSKKVKRTRKIIRKKLALILILAVFFILIAVAFVIALALGGYIPSLEPAVGNLSAAGIGDAASALESVVDNLSPESVGDAASAPVPVGDTPAADGVEDTNPAPVGTE